MWSTLASGRTWSSGQRLSACCLRGGGAYLVSTKVASLPMIEARQIHPRVINECTVVMHGSEDACIAAVLCLCVLAAHLAVYRPMPIMICSSCCGYLVVHQAV